MDDRLRRGARGVRRRRGRRRCRGRRAGPRRRSARRPARAARGRDRPAGVDADQRRAGPSPRVLLDDLVRDTHQRPPQIVAVEDDLVGQSLKLCPFLASRDRVKGTDAASLAGWMAEIRDEPTSAIMRRWPPLALRPPARRSRSTRQPAGDSWPAARASFVREQGEGAPVVLLHGVPTSSFLYRKVIPAAGRAGASRRGLRLPGPRPGRAARRASTTSGQGSRAGRARRSTRSGIERCHLVVHDIGGPIGLRVGGRQPGARALPDGAQHAARRGALPPPLDDGTRSPLPVPRAGSGLRRLRPRVVLAALLPPGNRGSLSGTPRTRSMPTTSC